MQRSGQEPSGRRPGPLRESLRDRFLRYARARKATDPPPQTVPCRDAEEALQRLLEHPLVRPWSDAARRAFTDPYFPSLMLAQTLWADVTGMRFFISKDRPEWEELLAEELRASVDGFLTVRRDIERYYDPLSITCIPLDGTPHPLPSGQWCRMCGRCCQIGGIAPVAPPGVKYPDHWRDLFEGNRHPNQQCCPFLFQYFGTDRFFCAVHTIKPVACRSFGPEDCRRCEEDILLHRSL